MKKLLITIMCSACYFISSAQRSEPVTTWNFEDRVAASIKEVNATVNGSFSVTGHTASEATVELFISGNSPDIRSRQWSDDEIKQELERSFTIIVKVEGGQLLVEANPKTNRPQFSLSIKISVPEQTNNNLSSTGGSIRISDLISNVSATAINGNLTANNIIGEVRVEATNGNMKLDGISGNVDAKVVLGYQGVNSNNDAHMTVSMDLVKDYVKLSNNTGNAMLTLPSNIGYNLNIKADNVTTTGLKDFKGNNERNKLLEGAIGNGGPLVEINASQQANLTFK